MLLISNNTKLTNARKQNIKKEILYHDNATVHYIA